MSNNRSIQEIEELFETMRELWNRHDTAGYAALWKQDADFVNVAGMHRSSRQELQAEVEWLHGERMKDTHIRIEKSKIRLLAPHLAIAQVWWEMTGDPGAPEYPTHGGLRRGIFTHVIERTADGWRFLASQNTDRLPVPDPFHDSSPVIAARKN